MKQADVNHGANEIRNTGARHDPLRPRSHRRRAAGRRHRAGRDRAYRYPIKIANGTVDYAGSAAFTVTGKVGANGAVTVTVSRGSQSASGAGRLSVSDGSGRWQTASGECSGTWSAERRS